MSQKAKKALRILILLCILIGLVALSVGIMAIAKQQYVIATAMMPVAAWQIVNYKRWSKNL